MGIVGAVIYLSLPKSMRIFQKRIITQAVIADAAGVSEVTIRNVYKEIEKKTFARINYPIFYIKLIKYLKL